jgi:N-formylglutamate amidohydrolase
LIFREQGFEVDVNRPFAGTMAPAPFFRRAPNVVSVMIEINRSLYMVEATGHRLPRFQAHADIVHAILLHLITRATGS